VWKATIPKQKRLPEQRKRDDNGGGNSGQRGGNPGKTSGKGLNRQTDSVIVPTSRGERGTFYQFARGRGRKTEGKDWNQGSQKRGSV